MMRCKICIRPGLETIVPPRCKRGRGGGSFFSQSSLSSLSPSLSFMCRKRRRCLKKCTFATEDAKKTEEGGKEGGSVRTGFVRQWKGRGSSRRFLPHREPPILFLYAA